MRAGALTALCLLAVLGTASLGSAECPTYWTRFRRHCYRFFGAHRPWREAESHCNAFSPTGHSEEAAVAHLVSIANEAENDFVYGLWSSTREVTTNDSVLWLGFHKPRGRNYFTWSNGGDVDFVSWDVQRPNDVGGEEDCAEMWEMEIPNHRLKSWNDRPCTHKASYMCRMQFY